MSRMHWHPKTGEMQVFEDDVKEPEGWLDHHPGDSKVADEDDDGPGGNLSKKEVMEALTAAELPFNSRDNLATLTAQLDEAVNSALANLKIQASPGASLRDRLALVTG